MTHNPSKLRLVRCPKCDHLLPELPAYSVYLCGGCGAYLKADRKPTLLELIDRSSLSWDSAATADAAAADSMAYREGGADVDRRRRTPERRYYQENNLALPVRVSKSPIRISRAEDSTEGSEFGGFARADPRYKPSPPRSVRSGAASRISSPMKSRVSTSKSPVRSLRGGREPTPTRERNHMEDTAPYRSPSKSPVRRGATEGGGFGGFSSSPHGTSPVRSVRGGGEGFKKSPARDDGVVDEYYANHKSSPLRSVKDHNSRNKSPARSVRGGFAKSPARSYNSPARSMERDGTRSPLRQRDLGNPEQMPADEKVGAWIDQAMIGKVIEGEQSDGRGNPLFQQKITSFGDWLDSDQPVAENPQPQQHPPRRRGSKSPRNRRQWRADEPPIPEREEVYYHTTVENEYLPEVDDLYARRRIATEVHHGGRRGGGEPRYRKEGRAVEEEVRYVDRHQYERVSRSRYPPDIYNEKPRNSYESSTAGSHDSSEIGRAELYRKCVELQAQILLMDGSDPPQPPPIRRGRPVAPSQSYDELYGDDHLRVRSPYHNRGRSRSPYNAGHPDFIPYARGPPETVLLNMPPYEDEDPALPGTPKRVSAPYYHPRPQPEPYYGPRRIYMEQPPAHHPVNQYHLPRENLLHHPNCHCPRCQVSTLHAQAHPQAAASSGGGVYHHRRSSSSQTEPVAAVSAAHHPDPRGYNPRFSNSSPHMKSTSAGVVTASEDSSGSTQPHNRRRRNTTALPKTRVCRPVSRAAPFVVCIHCSELLKLPKKVRAIKNSKVKCGSCSNTLEFDLEMKMIPHDPISPQFNYSSGTTVAASTVASYNESLPLQSKHGSGSLGTMVKDSEQQMLDESVEGKALQDSLAGGLSSESFTVDKLYTFPSSGSEASLLLEELRRRKSNPEAAAEMQQQQVPFPPFSSHASKELEQPSMNLNEAAAALEKKRNTTTTTPSPPLIGKDLVRPPPGSPLREHIDYSNILKQGVADGGILRRSSIESNSSSSDESEGFAKGDPDPMANSAHSRVSSTDTTSSGGKDDPESEKKNVSGGGLVFPDINGLQGFDNSSVSSSMTATATTGKADVFVNGQPISQRKVKSAESLAGPISPGDYWYDSRAGFWGVMGRHCLGIIPPFIQEFVFPMPVNCAGGNTEIYVNGRELHESDLDVLASRRLPRTKNKFYRIDITGRVEIEHTGEFVCELGRLAPSVEKNRRGFGMTTPYTD